MVGVKSDRRGPFLLVPVFRQVPRLLERVNDVVLPDGGGLQCDVAWEGRWDAGGRTIVAIAAAGAGSILAAAVIPTAAAVSAVSCFPAALGGFILG